MREFDEGRWSVGFVCSFFGSVFPKAFPASLPSGCFALALSLIFTYTFTQPANSSATFPMVRPFFIILGILLVFRSTEAFARFWAGAEMLRTIRGQWFNAAASLFAFSSPRPELAADVQEFQQQLVQLTSLLFAAAVNQLSLCDSELKLEIISTRGLDPESLAYLADQNEKTDVVLQWMQQLIVEKAASGVVDISPPLLTRVFQELCNGYTNFNSARVISEVPFPFPYAQLIAIGLVANSFLMPLVTTFALRVVYFAAPSALVIVLGLWSINFIAMEIEMPFGQDVNDVSTKQMVRNMNRSLLNLLDERTKNCAQVWSHKPLRPSQRLLWSGGKVSLIMTDDDDFPTDTFGAAAHSFERIDVGL